MPVYYICWIERKSENAEMEEILIKNCCSFHLLLGNRFWGVMHTSSMIDIFLNVVRKNGLMNVVSAS